MLTTRVEADESGVELGESVLFAGGHGVSERVGLDPVERTVDVAGSLDGVVVGAVLRFPAVRHSDACQQHAGLEASAQPFCVPAGA